MFPVNNNHSNKSNVLNQNSVKMSLFYHCPIGIIILEKTQNENNIECQLKFLNIFASNLMELPQECNLDIIKDKFKGYKRWEMNKLTEITLSSQIFDDLTSYKNLNGTYIGEYSMIYVKVKNIHSNILICIDNYTEERKSIQLNLMQSLQYQYLLTLYHEINNPMNALINLVDEDCDSENNDNNNNNTNANINLNLEENSFHREFNTLFKKGWIVLLVKLIKFFIKNFVWYVKIVFELNRNRIMANRQPISNKDNTKTTHIQSPLIELDVHLNIGYIFKSINKKYELLFQYKDVISKTDFSSLENKFIVSNEKYFKNFLNALYMFLYNVVPKKNGFELEITEISKNKILTHSQLQELLETSTLQYAINTNKNLLMITYKKLQQNHKQHNHNPFHIDDIDFGYKQDYKASKTVQTIEFMRDLIMNFAHLLKIHLQLFSYGNDATKNYISFVIPYETLKEEFDLENVDEFTPRKSQNVLLNNAVNRQMIIYNNINQTTTTNSQITNGANVMNGNFCDSVSDDDTSEHRHQNQSYHKMNYKNPHKKAKHIKNRDLGEISLLDHEKASIIHFSCNNNGNNNFNNQMQNECGFYENIDYPFFKVPKNRFSMGCGDMENSMLLGQNNYNIHDCFSTDQKHETDGVYDQNNNLNSSKNYEKNIIHFNDNKTINSYIITNNIRKVLPNPVINIFESTGSIRDKEFGHDHSYYKAFSTYTKKNSKFKRQHSRQLNSKNVKLTVDIPEQKKRLNLSTYSSIDNKYYNNISIPINEVYPEYHQENKSKISYASAMVHPVHFMSSEKINSGRKTLRTIEDNIERSSIQSAYHLVSKKTLKIENNSFVNSSHCHSPSKLECSDKYTSVFNYLSGYIKPTKRLQHDIQKPRRKDTFEFKQNKNILKIPQGCSCANVLLCDDEEFNLSTISRCFKKQNIITDKCTNGKECIEQIQQKAKFPCSLCNCKGYKVLLLDIMMPVMDGVEATKKIQMMMDKGEIGKELQIIIISAHIDEELKKRLNGIKCVKEYIVKPVKNDKIKQIIQQYCFGMVPQDSMNSNLTLENA